MFAVIFEVQPRKGKIDAYLDLAKFLKPRLEAIDGFIDNERFASARDRGRVLSLSTWRDEKAAIRWRTLGVHHGVQEKGRSEVFKDYHLRVGEISADSAPLEGVPIEEMRFDETVVGEAKCCTITEVSPASQTAPPFRSDGVLERLRLDPRAEGLLEYELFEGITRPGKRLILGSWRDKSGAGGWKPARFDGVGEIRHRQVRIIRDYGMFDRREAPQFHPDVH